MAAITITDLNNAKLDAEHLAVIATSEAPTVTDRLGRTKKTLAGLSSEFPNAMVKAAEAAASAGIAVAAEDAAEVHKLAAQAAKNGAETARETAQLSSGVYATTTAGLAATTNGKFFSVPSGTGPEFLDLYLNDAGSAVFQRTVQQPRTVSKRTNVLFGVAGYGGKMPLYVDLAGNMWTMGINLTELTEWIKPSTNLSMWGDSMTMFLADSTGFQDAFDGRTLRNFGIGGQTSEQIFARQGALPTLVTLTGNTIPATTAPVVITALSVELLSTVSDATVRSISGTLGGVEGSLTRAADDTYTFARAAAGSAVVVDAQVQFVPETSYSRETTIFWPGRNDIYADVPLATIQGYITRAIAHLKSIDKHFLLLSCLNASTEYAANATSTGETNYPTEAARYNAVVALNLWMKQTYPENYVEVRRALIRNYDSGDAQDVIDFGRDVVPDSLRTDAIHLSVAGNTIVTSIIAAEFNARRY